MANAQGEPFWGKAERQGADGLRSLPLASHCLDVAFVFRALLELPVLRRRLESAAGGPLHRAQVERLAVIALLHDLGKANLGFQGKIFDPKAPQIGHIGPLAPLFTETVLNQKLAAALNVDRLFSWFALPEALQGFLLASWSHHGKPVRFDPDDRTGDSRRWWQPDGNRDPFQAIAELTAAAREAFPAAFAENVPPIPGVTRLQHRVAGLVMLADWLGSHQAFFPLERPPDFDAKRAATNAVRAVGIDASVMQAELVNRPALFEKRFGCPPRPLQATLDALACDDPANRLLIAEAETGSGKTEAALVRFFHLFALGEVDALYFALPTRVAAREIYRRVRVYLRRAFPNPHLRPRAVLAVPCYARVGGIPVERLLPDRENRCHDEEDQRRAERIWAAEHPKRFLGATVAVGTIDQALLSAIQAPHAHMRSVCLDRSLLVVDEVHASDPYMRRLLQGLLEHHVGLRGHALLLSATLGARARAEFTRHEVPEFATACAAPYPSLTDLNGVLRAVSPGPATSRQKGVRVELRPVHRQPEALIPDLAEKVAVGARVLVVMNTVDRAVAFQRALEASAAVPRGALFRASGVICPHHGRFTPADREVLDRAVTSRLGKSSGPGPIILVGTQTLEQSLDIDADLLITDLCPMDVLLQRVGRLYRHARDLRPLGKTAPCWVLIPEQEDFSELLSETGEANGEARKAGLGSVYPDFRTLQLTRDLLAASPDIAIPQDNRRLVEGATHPEPLSSLTGPRWARHAQKLDGHGLAQQVQAHYALLTRLYDKPFGEFTFHEVGDPQARTRLGLDNLRLPLDRPVPGPFGVSIAEMLIPARLAPHGSPDEPITVLSIGADETVLAYGDRRYRYSRFGLELADEPAD